MRTCDDQLHEIVRRAGHIKEKKSAHKAAASLALASCSCLLLLGLTVFYLPLMSGTQSSQARVRYGSLLLSSPHTGYVLIAVLAFLLGVSVTLLVKQLFKLRKIERERQ